MRRLLITRPEHDDTTHYLSRWSQDCIEFAEEKGISVLDLQRERANKAETTSMLQKHQPRFVVLNGHGSETTVTGHANQEIITAGKNEELLKGKIVYAWSCQSAKVLGPKSIQAGATAYIGYNDDFIFVYDPLKISKPREDKTAKLFMEPSNELINSLLKGQSAKEAVRRSQELFKDKIKHLLSSEASKEDIATARYLWWDMKHQVCHGDQEATFK